MPAPLRLILDGTALVANWRALAARAPAAACGAAIKADGYGLGARAVMERLSKAGCRYFFVATWDEAAALGALPEGAALSVLHGVREADMAAAMASAGRPVLNSAAQVARWREAAGGPCDVMIDTGMNRLGLSPEEALSGLLDGLTIDTLMSHLACADDPGHALNGHQRAAFAALAARIPARRTSLANSAGIFLGADYAFDLVRPGLALYGGVPTPDATDIAPVVSIEADVLQIRAVPTGASVGYGATWVAPASTRVAILNIGYADGLLRQLGPALRAVGEHSVALPVRGRVSMDLIAVELPEGVAVEEGAAVRLAFDLPRLAEAAALSQYELLTGLGARFDRQWR